MNKKGQFFTIFFVAAVIFLLTYAYFMFDKKQNSFETELGNLQLELLETYYKAERALFYSDMILKYSAPQSIFDLGKNGGYFNEPECGHYGDFILWSYKDKECFPNNITIRNNIRRFLGKYVNEYSDASLKLGTVMKLDNYDYVFDEKDGKLMIKGVAAAPLYFTIYCSTSLGNCGKYAAKPNSYTEIDYSLLVYDEIAKEVKKIKEICLDKNVKTCVEAEVGKRNNWNLVEEEVEEEGIDKERTFRISIMQMDKEFFVYYKDRVDKLPVEIRFAINFPDNNAPLPVENLDAADYFFAEKYVILMWDKSKADDVEKYKIYYKESNDLIDDVFNKDEFMIKEVKDALILKDFKFSDPNIEKERLYNLNDEQYVYALKLDFDLIDYVFGVTGVDYYGNENNTIESSVIVKSIDDLPPGNVIIQQLSYDPLSKELDIKWKDVVKNADDSVLEDLDGYRIYFKDSYFTDIREANVFDTKDALTTFIVKYVPELIEGIDYYFAVVGFDDDGNEYEEVEPKRVRI